MKFCKDCRYFDTTDATRSAHARCIHPNSGRSNNDHLVTGEGSRIEFQYCSAQRIDKCGPDAKDFEARIADDEGDKIDHAYETERERLAGL